MGEKIKSRNPVTGQDEAKTVTLTDAKTGQTEALTCTPEHPFFVTGQGWVEAGSLGIGTSIVSRAGPALSVTNVTWKRDKSKELAAGSLSGGYTVYNLTVEDDHTYFVGTTDGGTWVHNNCYTTLYRAVGPEESADIAETGAFRAGNGSMTGKWFAENAEDAATWGQRFYGNSLFDIVAARFRASTADQMFQMERLDNIGPARYADPDLLNCLREITFLPH